MNLDYIIAYAKSLLDVKYTAWSLISGETMFYNTIDELPTITTIQKIGINCAGVINLLRLYNKKQMPYLEGDYVVGGTVFWYDYFNNRNELELFDSTASYPFGTLILRRYRDTQDQGHLAVIIENNHIIHAYCDDQWDGMVGITPLCENSDYYDYIVKSQYWLN